MAPVNNSSARSYYVISDLCGRYIDAQQIEPLEQQTPEQSAEEAMQNAPMQQQQQQQQQQIHSHPPQHPHQHQHQQSHPQHPQDVGGGEAYQPWFLQQQPVGESPQTQINSVFSMMWPNVPPMEAADVVMGDEAGWMEFLRAGSMEGWPPMDP
jgi:transcriptional regulatory protein GAL4